MSLVKTHIHSLFFVFILFLIWPTISKSLVTPDWIPDRIPPGVSSSLKCMLQHHSHTSMIPIRNSSWFSTPQAGQGFARERPWTGKLTYLKDSLCTCFSWMTWAPRRIQMGTEWQRLCHTWELRSDQLLPDWLSRPLVVWMRVFPARPVHPKSSGPGRIVKLHPSEWSTLPQRFSLLICNPEAFLERPLFGSLRSWLESRIAPSGAVVIIPLDFL